VPPPRAQNSRPEHRTEDKGTSPCANVLQYVANRLDLYVSKTCLEFSNRARAAACEEQKGPKSWAEGTKLNVYVASPTGLRACLQAQVRLMPIYANSLDGDWRGWGGTGSARVSGFEQRNEVRCRDAQRPTIKRMKSTIKKDSIHLLAS
jgi:hypothetical protein